MINIFAQRENYFVWNADDVIKLRAEHRIIGSLVGCLPRQAFQNSQKWLPLQLLPEEAKLLAEKVIATVVTNPAVTGKSSPEAIKLYWENRDKKCQDQIAIYKETREKVIMEKASIIMQGKRKAISEGFEHRKVAKRQRRRLRDLIQQIEVEETKVKNHNDGDQMVKSGHSGNKPKSGTDVTSSVQSCDNHQTAVIDSVECDNHIDEENESLNQNSNSTHVEECDEQSAMNNAQELKEKAIIEGEVAKFHGLNKESCMVQLFTECVWKKEEENVPALMHFPATEQEKLKYAVFKDLWEKGFYLTSGLKFGGDYLAYSGDPVKCHALYIVYCIPNKKNFYAEDIITFGRVSNQVKKTYVLASVTGTGSVEYLSLLWASDMVSSRKK